MSQSPAIVKASMPDPIVAEDEGEDDAWDKRIRKTGCFAENEQLLVCHADTNDWRQCARELAAFKKCMEQNKGSKYPRNYFDDDVKMHGREKKVALFPLLSVSEFWREAALASICDNCKLDYNGALKAVEVKYYAWPADFSYSRFRRHSLVKRVVLTAPHWADMCEYESGEAIA
ncbi:hypothetical protein GGH94_004072 [Coemansia aciculifera]|uniref:CHCH domain-containing protein n=1 Tax=Coemansia aciculifera TaxID=417176 RepID=A0A9W8M2I9_9FUNG|nr:hypothetical protein GGH94_004072 [Coemansia aciculifera]